METTLLPIRTESLEPKLFVVGGSQPSGGSGLCLDDTTGPPTLIQCNQNTATMDIRGHGDRNIYFGSLVILTEVIRRGLGQSSNDRIGVNQPGNIGSN